MCAFRRNTWINMQKREFDKNLYLFIFASSLCALFVHVYLDLRIGIYVWHVSMAISFSFHMSIRWNRWLLFFKWFFKIVFKSNLIDTIKCKIKSISCPSSIRILSPLRYLFTFPKGKKLFHL